MKTTTANQNNYRCPQCGDEIAQDKSSRGFVRHKNNRNCGFERGQRDEQSPQRRTLSRVARLMVIGLLLSRLTSAFADPITVPNFSFETPAIGSDATTYNSVSGWTGLNSFGIINPSDSAYPGTTGPDALLPGTALGSQAAFLGTVNGSRPTLTTSLLSIQGNTIYTLTIAIGIPNDISIDFANSPPSAFASLTANGNIIVSAGGQAKFIPQGTFADFSTSFTTAATGDSLVGQQLGIQLLAVGPSSGLFDFDNVRVYASPVPEPSTLWLAIFGAFLLLQLKRNISELMSR